MKNKLTITLVAFLLLIPLRLPVSILFIHFFEWILGITTKEIIPKDVLATNIIVSKFVYNIAISALFLVNLEMFSREKMGRKAKMFDSYKKQFVYQACYWWVVPIGMLLFAFIIIDAISVYNIFFI